MVSVTYKRTKIISSTVHKRLLAEQTADQESQKNVTGQGAGHSLEHGSAFEFSWLDEFELFSTMIRELVDAKSTL